MCVCASACVCVHTSKCEPYAIFILCIFNASNFLPAANSDIVAALRFQLGVGRKTKRSQQTFRHEMLPVSHGWDTWSPTRRKEHRLRVFENMMLREQFAS